MTHLSEYTSHTHEPVVPCTTRRHPSRSLAGDHQSRKHRSEEKSGAYYLGWRQTTARSCCSGCRPATGYPADTLAGRASAPPQEDLPVDARTVPRARAARSSSIAEWPPGWYRSLIEDGRLPPPVRHFDRSTAIDIHQIRAGHCLPSPHRTKPGAQLRLASHARILAAGPADA